MKRVFVIAFLLMVAISRAQSVVYLNSTDNIGTSRTNLNGNFSNLLPFVQAGYSNRIDLVGVTNQPAGTVYIVTNGANRWLLIGTNDGGSATSTSTPQGPWTNWIAGATWGVSNAGTFNMASSNLVFITLGTNRLTVQGTASEPTNLAWNGNSLWNIGGGSLGLWATNAHLGSVTALHFIGTASVTGEEGYVTAGDGGTAVGIFSNGTFVANSTNINFVGSGVGAITGNTVNINGGGGGATLTNAYAPTALIAGAGDTVTVTTASGPLLYFQPTANVNRLTFDSSWSSSQVGLVTIDIYAGPYSITWDTNAITNTVYVSLATNTGLATPLIFRKSHGQSQWRVRQ